MTEGLHRLELDRELNRDAWEQAKEAGLRKDRYLAALITEYGRDFTPPPPKPPVVDDRDLVEVRVWVEDAAWDRAKARARTEEKSVSAVLHDLVSQAGAQA